MQSHRVHHAVPVRNWKPRDKGFAEATSSSNRKPSPHGAANTGARSDIDNKRSSPEGYRERSAKEGSYNMAESRGNAGSKGGNPL